MVGGLADFSLGHELESCPPSGGRKMAHPCPNMDEEGPVKTRGTLPINLFTPYHLPLAPPFRSITPGITPSTTSNTTLYGFCTPLQSVWNGPNSITKSGDASNRDDSFRNQGGSREKRRSGPSPHGYLGYVYKDCGCLPESVYL